MTGELARLVEWKRRIARELEEAIGREAAERARRDHHARRRPRHCGMTIHTGIGCSYGCVYCYIWDMGFPGKPEPYPLTGEELAYALAVNPYVVPGKTMAAYGSVTEPFQPETTSKALEYIEAVWRWLRLPSQVSTKSLLTGDLVERLRKAEPRISVLLTIVALGEWARRLEPRAPPAEERIELAGEAVRRGLRVALFVRPIIPGVTDRQADEIFALARRSGLSEAVLGSLRVTPGILDRLEAVGVPRSLLEARLPRKPRSRRDQVTLRMSDVKARVASVARRHGFLLYPSACSHNMESHGEPCHACNYGPCGPGRPRVPQPGEVREAVEAMGGRVREVVVEYPRIVVEGLSGVDPVVVREFLSAATRLMVSVGSGGSSRRRRRP